VPDMTRRIFLARVGALAAAVPLATPALAACSTTNETTTGAEGGLAAIKKKGVARLAVANEPPYTLIEADGTLTGAAPEVARAVLKRLDIDVEGVVTPYESMIPGLQAHRWDIITAGLFMKKSRCAEVLYSDPDVVSTESFLVEKGNPRGLTSFADVKKQPDLKLVVLSGGFEEGLAKQAGIPGSQLVSIPEGRAAIDILKAGRAEAFALPTLSLQDLIKDGLSGWEITPPLKDAPTTGAGAAFRKSDRDFRDAYNEKFREIKDSGEFAKILEPWGFSAEAAMSVTTEELCQTEG